MPKAVFYAVAKGRVPGVYTSWNECEPQVKGFTGSRFKKFTSRKDAEQFIGLPARHSSSSSIPSTSKAKMSRIKSVAFSAKAGPEEDGWDVVYADGACKGNGKPGSVAGIGVWWGENDSRNLAERCPGAQTNNRAELIAILRVLETTLPIATQRLLIKTDSKYSIHCLTEWFHKWKKAGWKTNRGGPVVNRDLIKYILALLQYRNLLGQRVKFEYVQGHAGIEGNEGADYQANRGAELPEKADRVWANECSRMEKLIKEWEEGVEVVDKAVQVNLETEDDQEEDDLIWDESDILDLKGMEAELAGN